MTLTISGFQKRAITPAPEPHLVLLGQEHGGAFSSMAPTVTTYRLSPWSFM